MFKRLILIGFVGSLTLTTLNPIAEARSNTGTKPFMVYTVDDLRSVTPSSVYFYDAMRKQLDGESITEAVQDGSIFPLYREHVTEHDTFTGAVKSVPQEKVSRGDAALRRHCRSRLKADGAIAIGCANYVQPEENPAAVQALVNAK